MSKIKHLIGIIFIIFCGYVQAADVYIAGGAKTSELMVAKHILKRTPVSLSTSIDELHEKITSDKNGVMILTDVMYFYMLEKYPNTPKEIKIVSTAGQDMMYIVKKRGMVVNGVFGGPAGIFTSCTMGTAMYAREHNIPNYKFLPYVNQQQKNLDILAGRIVGCGAEYFVKSHADELEILEINDQYTRLILTNAQNPEYDKLKMEVTNNFNSPDTKVASDSSFVDMTVRTDKELQNFMEKSYILYKQHQAKVDAFKKESK
jgi:hypothetical protein